MAECWRRVASQPPAFNKPIRQRDGVLVSVLRRVLDDRERYPKFVTVLWVARQRHFRIIASLRAFFDEKQADFHNQNGSFFGLSKSVDFDDDSLWFFRANFFLSDLDFRAARRIARQDSSVSA